MNPATNEVVTTFAVGSVADVDRAVGAARRAFDEGPWPRLTAKERKTYFTRLVGADHRARRGAQPAADTRDGHAHRVLLHVGGLERDGGRGLRPPRGWIDKICGSTYPTYEAGPTGADVQIMSFREPVGVVAAIIPWNAPMMLFAQKVAPALATGLHRRRQAVRVCRADVAQADRADRGGGLPARRLQPRARAGQPDRRSAHHPPRRRQGHLHREPGRRASASSRRAATPSSGSRSSSVASRPASCSRMPRASRARP